VWECALRKPEQVEASTEGLSIWLRTEELQIEIGDNNARRS
jgi:DNA mismatch endonuclease (patch repair protein)